VTTLAESCKTNRVRLHLLATAEVSLDNPVRQLVEATGGTVVTEPNPQRWSDAARELYGKASQSHFVNERVEVNLTGPLASLRPIELSQWNHVWTKDATTPLAVAATSDGDVALAALWNLGAGRAAAAGFSDESVHGALVELVESPARDPRFEVWLGARDRLRVTIDALAGDRFLNELPLTLELRDASDPARASTRVPIPQVAPGRYELLGPAPRTPAIAIVRNGNEVLERHAIAGRYPPEFDAIGLNRSAVEELASRTGGRVVDPSDKRPIDFPRKDRWIDITAPLAATGALLVALGLIHWRLT
jgi:hypothetical protein